MQPLSDLSLKDRPPTVWMKRPQCLVVFNEPKIGFIIASLALGAAKQVIQVVEVESRFDSAYHLNRSKGIQRSTCGLSLRHLPFLLVFGEHYVLNL